MKKRLLIDTNVLRRILENSTKCISILRYYINKGYEISISDHSLFEIFDYLDTHSNNKNEEYRNILLILKKYNVNLLYRKDSESFYDNYNYFIEGKYTIKEVKNFLYQSFKFSLLGYLVNIYSLSVIALANSLDDTYKTPFYQYIQNLFNENYLYKEVEEHISKLLRKGYLQNQEKVNNFVKRDLKDLAIRVLCYHRQLKNKTELDSVIFNEDYKYFNVLYKAKQFKDIIKDYYKQNALVVKNKNGLDEFSLQFIIEHIKDLVEKGGSFSINHVVDYLNFINAYGKDMNYFTLDNESLNKYEKYFKNNNLIMNYLMKIKNIKNIPYNVICYYNCN